jgi:hypothetical protein
MKSMIQFLIGRAQDVMGPIDPPPGFTVEAITALRNTAKDALGNSNIYRDFLYGKFSRSIKLCKI